MPGSAFGLSPPHLLGAIKPQRSSTWGPVTAEQPGGDGRAQGAMGYEA